jgi:mannose-6-phosphate isomerase-like protein (cupin superfamily)
MTLHTIPGLLEEIGRSGRRYLEFIRVPDLSVGVYRLRPEEKDQQKPHTEDEVYYLIAGRAKFWCADSNPKVREVGPGAVLFVERGVEHRFIDIVEELVVLVVFGPAEGSGTVGKRIH